MSAKLRKYLEDQAECIARINDEWLLWPSEAHSREKADAIEGKIVSILGSDSTLGRITARDGTVLLFWCASPSEAQREQVATLEEVRRLLPMYPSHHLHHGRPFPACLRRRL